MRRALREQHVQLELATYDRHHHCRVGHPSAFREFYDMQIARVMRRRRPGKTLGDGLARPPAAGCRFGMKVSHDPSGIGFGKPDSSGPGTSAGCRVPGRGNAGRSAVAASASIGACGADRLCDANAPRIEGKLSRVSTRRIDLSRRVVAAQAHQAMGLRFLKNPPVGPSFGKVASHTAVSAPCAAVVGA